MRTRSASTSEDESLSFSFTSSSMTSSASSPELSISDSDFRFDSIDSELPLSPKLICPTSSPTYWTPGAISQQQQQPVKPPRPPAIDLPRRVARSNGPSVRQLIASDKSTESVDFYTAPSTPRTPRSPMGMAEYVREELSQSFEEHTRAKRNHSNGGSSSNTTTNNSSSSKALVKQTSKKSWAFKDLLRRTVPSSKFDSPRKSAAARSETVQYTPPMTPRTPRSPPVSAPQSPARSRVSPPMTPRSPHARHYPPVPISPAPRKTFLPYRQSLLGCLGGGAFVAETAY